ncbi:phage terminase large subunit [Salinarimonas soli]|uniref:Phage terminase large subunit n=1 Tax=Salinarimonas soli TaxID=1638099 RepID=A0A5B2VBI6_9HYPH|nr:phage terminase large subunit [Salinarimonas soli]KAA2236441.1 phage terminase large subunit [Salinarimonas soli]
MSDRRRFLQAILRSDLAAFVEKCFNTLEPGTAYHDNWHIHAIAHALTRVWRGECRRLIINVPPRSMKSITVSVAFTAWVMGHAPHKRVMAVSYAAELSRKLGLDTRTVLESPWFGELFPAFQIAAARANEVATTRRGYRLAGSVTGPILGRGADLIVVDDPIKGLAAALSAAERRKVTEFYDNTLYSRLDDKVNGAIVIVMQRLHEDDLVGHVLAKEDWEVISIPAIAVEDTAYRIGPDADDVYHRRAGDLLHPGREPAEVLERLRRNLGTLNFSAQYQQNPMPAGGNVIRREWLRHYDERPHEFDLVVTSWDTASTIGEASDWSVGTVWGAVGQEYYLLDVVRGRWEVPDLRRHIVGLAREHRADVTIIEDTELGRALVQDLRRTGELYPILQPARFDKQARLLAQAARFEAGQVRIPRETPWLGGYLSELLAFPTGRHDDQVDSTSQALRYLTARTPVEPQRPQTIKRPQRIRRA